MKRRKTDQKEDNTHICTDEPAAQNQCFYLLATQNIRTGRGAESSERIVRKENRECREKLASKQET